MFNIPYIIFVKYLVISKNKICAVVHHVLLNTHANHLREGFKLAYSVLIACGQVVNHTLKSPGYPNNYQNSTDCSYVIPISQGTRLNIIFKDFDVEPGPNCG